MKSLISNLVLFLIILLSIYLLKNIEYRGTFLRKDLNGTWIHKNTDNFYKLSISDNDCSLEIEIKNVNYFFNGSCHFAFSKEPMIMTMKNINTLDFNLHSSFTYVNKDTFLMSRFVNIEKAVNINSKSGYVFLRSK